jgi:drug/metabolite transporter (DMT)-like permease
MDATASHRLGLVLTGAAALAWSSAGVFTRLITADLATMLFWRGIFSGTTIFIVYLILEQRGALRKVLAMGLPGLGVAVLSAGGMISGIGAIRYGSVADAMVIYATVPFVTAGVAYLFIGERTTRSTIIASLIALAGVVIMLLGSDWGGSMTGKILAMGMTCCMAGFSVILRGHRDLPMLPAMALSAFLCASVCFSFADPLGVSTQNLLLCMAFGIFQNAAGLVFYTLGSRRIPAAEATLLAALEVPFTPLWVFLFMAETPGHWTLLGGGVVLAALFGHILGQFRRKDRTAESDFAPTL